MADPLPLPPALPSPEPDLAATLPNDLEKLAVSIAEEIIRLEKKIPLPTETLAPIVNVQSAVPSIQVMPATLPGTVVNVETVAPVINVLPAAAPSFNFHADSAAVGFDINTVVEQLIAMIAVIAAGNAELAAMRAQMAEQTNAIRLQGEAIGALASTLLLPRQIVMDAAGKPVGVKIGD